METRTFVSKQKKVIPVEVYSRVVGYYRPTNQWNPGECKKICVNSRKNIQ